MDSIERGGPAAQAEGMPARLPVAEKPGKKWNPLAMPKRVLLGALAVIVIGAGVITALVVIKSQTPTGRVKWSRQIGPLGHSAPVVSNGVLYIGTEDNKVFALSVASGQVIWSTQLGEANPSSAITPLPVVSYGMIYVNSQAEALYALDAGTGHTIWTYEVYGGAMTTPVAANGIVYVGSEWGVLSALDALSGRKLWAFDTQTVEHLNFFEASPAVANGLVYADASDNGVIALDALSGQKRWVNFVPPADYTPTVADGVVYVTDLNGELSALDAASGEKLWSFLSTHCCGFASAALVVGKMTYVYSVGGVLAVDAKTHKERWFHEIEGAISTPAISDQIIYVIAGDRNFKPTPNSLDIFPDKDELVAIDATSGKELWYYPLDDLAFGRPAVSSDGVVYVGAEDDTLYALLPPN